jgi:hypothetical protein
MIFRLDSNVVSSINMSARQSSTGGTHTMQPWKVIASRMRWRQNSLWWIGPNWLQRVASVHKYPSAWCQWSSRPRPAVFAPTPRSTRWRPPRPKRLPRPCNGTLKIRRALRAKCVVCASRRNVDSAKLKGTWFHCQREPASQTPWWRITVWSRSSLPSTVPTIVLQTSCVTRFSHHSRFRPQRAPRSGSPST